MRSELLFVCLAVGVGTYLFRYLPTRLGKGAARPQLRGPLGAFLGRFLGSFLGRFLGSVGIAAVTALLVASLVGVLEPPVAAEVLAADPAGHPDAWPGNLGPRLASWVTAALGVAATLGAYLWRRDVAVSTILGAAAYGLAWWLVGLVF